MPEPAASGREALFAAIPDFRDMPRLLREQRERDGICADCNGMGGSFSGGLIRVFSRNCRTCKGTGRV